MSRPRAFQKTVTTAGTPVQLPAYPVDLGQTVLIKATTNKVANTGVITIGFTSDQADSNDSTSEFMSLSGGQAISLSMGSTGEIWIDSTVSNEGVEILIG